MRLSDKEIDQEADRYVGPSGETTRNERIAFAQGAMWVNSLGREKIIMPKCWAHDVEIMACGSCSDCGSSEHT
jgi:hypothetical protein